LLKAAGREADAERLEDALREGGKHGLPADRIRALHDRLLIKQTFGAPRTARDTEPRASTPALRPHRHPQHHGAHRSRLHHHRLTAFPASSNTPSTAA
jgi:hypothetical protein